MIRLVLENLPSVETSYRDSDITRMVKLAADNGYELSRTDAERLWLDYSDVVCATWLGLPESDDELWGVIRSRTRADL